MQTNHLNNPLQQAFVLLNFAAYPIIAVTSFAMGLDNSLLSLGLRSLIVVMAIVLIAKKLAAQRAAIANFYLYCVLFFWLCYFTRMTFDTLLSNKFLFHETYIYWMWAVGSSFLPAVALSLQNPTEIKWPKVFRKLYFALWIAAVLISLFASQEVEREYGRINSGRTELPSLNPIALGHVGASVLALATYSLAILKNRNWTNFLFDISAFLIGGYLIVASNSRGPLFATIAVLLFLIWSIPGKNKFKIIAISVGSLIAFAPVAIYLEEVLNVTTYSRLFGQNFFQEENVAGRADRYSFALSEFSQSPFVGSGLEPSDGSAYPHNIVVETFLSTGIFVGVGTIIILLLLLKEANRVMVLNPNAGWASVLFVQFLIGAQFSGALYDVFYFWSSLGLIVCLSGSQAVVNRMNAPTLSVVAQKRR